ncbi:hypothetical protein Theam_0966 [Thermovibrio ammonificans HB-1]|uniref:Cytochrome c domain-containing protein n=1 Tax=Thermovibrio ammonificans (strain DSM 15698 / JCM 12110 / HB-1) TaxID=648996 RepID=E8T238_THEA1|nr:hypothetical protein [Thermovibrio ammonificans]ADU96933.1 hypothetical protein Theam_0966 [Thermovibrio ammonificans HB-1]
MVKRRWKTTLSISSAFLMGLTLQAQAHGPVTLKDINGNPISQTLNATDSITIGGTTYYAGNPVSWEVTCGSCHSDVTGDVKGGLHSPGPIHATYHVGRGWDEMADDFGANRVREGKDWRKFLRSFGDDGAW